eukprot:10277717-Lingulodinium_polyedra.AAC.1
MDAGVPVELAGLQANTELNGMRGTCAGRADDGERWRVRLTNGRWASAREANLKRLDVPGLEGTEARAAAPKGP